MVSAWTTLNNFFVYILLIFSFFLTSGCPFPITFVIPSGIQIFLYVLGISIQRNRNGDAVALSREYDISHVLVNIRTKFAEYAISIVRILFEYFENVDEGSQNDGMVLFGYQERVALFFAKYNVAWLAELFSIFNLYSWSWTNNHNYWIVWQPCLILLRNLLDTFLSLSWIQIYN